MSKSLTQQKKNRNTAAQQPLLLPLPMVDFLFCLVFKITPTVIATQNDDQRAQQE
jgi:hypothetical protein